MITRQDFFTVIMVNFKKVLKLNTIFIASFGIMLLMTFICPELYCQEIERDYFLRPPLMSCTKDRKESRKGNENKFQQNSGPPTERNIFEEYPPPEIEINNMHKPLKSVQNSQGTKNSL